jgi:group II intron reverse transcriptase/maturase
MNGHGESDRVVVPGKPPNKGEEAAATEPAEVVEERTLAKENSRRQNAHRTQGRARVQSALERVRRAAREDRGRRFTALLHHVYAVDTLREAYLSLKRGAAPGVDGVTWREYGEGLEERLQDLSGRLQRGAYRARPVKRRYIPKPDGRQRPLGITTLEDKVVQTAVTMVLNQVYEVDFLGFSYGFRPQRSQHDALDALCVGIERRRVRWVLDADIRGFFDAIDHGCLVKLVEHRIADRRVIRLIQKWLKAGVLDEGKRVQTEEGTPQGGCISPLLANIYLHYVLDKWVQEWRRERSQGDVIIVRYADDFVMGFEHRHEAERCLEALRERLGDFGLELHPDKTRLIEFGRHTIEGGRGGGPGKPGTFDFLGFTHICARGRNGRFRVERRTMKKRMRAKLAEIKRELRRRIHDPVPETGKWLKSVIEGHMRYYGVPLNARALAIFRWQIAWLWKRALSRRSHKAYITWDRMERYMDRWLPKPRIYHPYPIKRLGVIIQGRSPVR